MLRISSTLKSSDWSKVPLAAQHISQIDQTLLAIKTIFPYVFATSTVLTIVIKDAERELDYRGR